MTLVTTDALEEVRGLEKMLVADQAVLFKKKLFVRSCRAADFCFVWGAYEKDCQFFREYSYIVRQSRESRLARLGGSATPQNLNPMLETP